MLSSKTVIQAILALNTVLFTTATPIRARASWDDWNPDSNNTTPTPPPLTPDNNTTTTNGTFMARYIDSIAGLSHVITLSELTSQGNTQELSRSIQEILQEAGLTSTNSTIAHVLLNKLDSLSSPKSKRDDSSSTNVNAISPTEEFKSFARHELITFLETCFRHDACIFYDHDTSELVDVNMSLRVSDVLHRRGGNESIWVSIAEWVARYGVDILVGDRSSTGNAVVPLVFVPIARVKAADIVLANSSCNN